MESGYAYPERSGDNVAEAWENAKAKNRCQNKEWHMVSPEVSRGHSKPATSPAGSGRPHKRTKD